MQLISSHSQPSIALLFGMFYPLLAIVLHSSVSKLCCTHLKRTMQEGPAISAYQQATKLKYVQSLFKYLALMDVGSIWLSRHHTCTYVAKAATMKVNLQVQQVHLMHLQVNFHCCGFCKAFPEWVRLHKGLMQPSPLISNLDPHNQEEHVCENVYGL